MCDQLILDKRTKNTHEEAQFPSGTPELTATRVESDLLLIKLTSKGPAPQSHVQVGDKLSHGGL